MNTAFDARLTAELDALRSAGTYKRLRHLTGPMAAEVHMEEAGDVIVLSSNNYLGLADHPDVVRAGIEGLQKYGAGTASEEILCAGGTSSFDQAVISPLLKVSIFRHPTKVSSGS